MLIALGGLYICVRFKLPSKIAIPEIIQYKNIYCKTISTLGYFFPIDTIDDGSGGKASDNFFAINGSQKSNWILHEYFQVHTQV